MKIYLTCNGSYDDYRTQAVFSNRDDAEKLAKVLDGNVEEWNLDECVSHVQMNEKPYYVSYTEYGGYGIEPDFIVSLKETVPDNENKLEVLYRNSFKTVRSFSMNLWAKSSEEAAEKFIEAKKLFLENEKNVQST